MAHLAHVAPLAKGAQDPVRIDTPDGRHLGPGHGLLVGDNGQRFQRGRRQSRGLAFQHETLDVWRQVGMALEPVAAGHPDELKATLLIAIGLGQLLADLGHSGRR